MTITKVEKNDKEKIKQIVEIHLSTFQGFFLTFMGRGFLRKMYQSYVKHKDSDIFIAVEEGKIVGFLAYSSNLSGLYKYMIKHKLIPFMWYSIGAFFRKPKVFMRLIRAFLRPSESKREEKYVELSSIGVSPDMKSRGVGSLLIDALKAEVDFSLYEYITLETDAVDNEGANYFYQKNGFALVRTYETREKRKMNEYRYEKKDEDFIS